MVQIPMKHFETNLFKSGKLPVLIYAGQISDDPEWSFSSHKHDDLSEIVYVSEGEGKFVVNNQTYQVQQGDILIYNKGVIHEERSNPENPLKTYFCGVGQLYIEGVEEGCIIAPHLVPVIHTGRYLYKAESYISEIFEESNSQVLGYEIICQNLLTSLIILILRIIRSENRELSSATPGNQGTSTSGNFAPAVTPGNHATATATATTDTLGYKIKEYIDKNYTTNISLNKIADRLYISPHYLSHIFKKETGYSPINYMINRRIGEAKKLLLTTEMNIQEIARFVGYDNANYFTMIFKKAMGVSPKKFKKTNLY